MAGFALERRFGSIQANSGPGTARGQRMGESHRLGSYCKQRRQTKVIILEVQTGAFGNYEQVLSVNAAIRTAIANGVVVCVAAGNGDRDAGLGDVGDPIQETGSILVGATVPRDGEPTRRVQQPRSPSHSICARRPSHDLTQHCLRHRLHERLRCTSGATPKVRHSLSCWRSTPLLRIRRSDYPEGYRVGSNHR